MKTYYGSGVMGEGTYIHCRPLPSERSQGLYQYWVMTMCDGSKSRDLLCFFCINMLML